MIGDDDMRNQVTQEETVRKSNKVINISPRPPLREIDLRVDREKVTGVQKIH